MAKLNQLLTLENMLEAYDQMSINDPYVLNLQYQAIGSLVDSIIAKLNRLLNSKVRLSCRNVLVANFETMTKTGHWLKSRLFADLPKTFSKALREKVEQMVELMKALMIKIINVDADFADRFFERLKKKYMKKHITNYEIWKAQLPQLTLKLVREYQAEITASMLTMGILRYDRVPSDQELDEVKLETLQKMLRHGRDYPENFKEECAKLRRYSHWEGDLFIIDYPLLRKYMFRNFGKMNSDQHIALFEYDIQMKQIHQDMKTMQSVAPSLLPDILATDKAMELWKKAQEAGYVDEHYHPKLSRTQSALLADAMAERLGIRNKWKVFEQLWDRKNIRSDYNLAFSQKKSHIFIEKLKNVIY